MNQQLNVLLVDDQRSCIETMKSALSAFSHVRVVGESLNATDTVKFLESNKVDLVFLDIEMGETNGFELARHIHSVYNILIVFLTGHAGFALTGYEYHPADFLVKPVSAFRLGQTLARIADMMDDSKVNKDIRIGIHVEGGLEIINVNQILYIEKIGRKVYIICEDGTRLVSSNSLQKLETIFEPYHFFRSHQSFLIPIDKIKSLRVDEFKRSYTLQISNAKELLPISRDKYNEIKGLLLQRGISFYK